jgi:hypothetical protein
MENSEAQGRLEEKFPSVELAYDIAVASNDGLVKRLDWIDGRIQTMVAFFVSITAAVPALAAARGVGFRSGWFYLAIALMILATILACKTRLSGEVALLDADKLNSDRWLSLSEWEFKNYMIQAAAQAFVVNNKLITNKWRWSVAISIVFLLGSLCLVGWVVASTRPA